LTLNKASKSVVPIKEDIVNIANNKNNEPNTDTILSLREACASPRGTGLLYYL
jgi:hypothetical protein